MDGTRDTVSILEGTAVPDQSLRLFRQMQDKPEGPLSWYDRELDDEAFRRTMVEERRVIYEFEVHRTYGMY